MQTINQLNETIRILQSNIATKDATIKALEQELNDCSDNKILPEESSLVIVVPTSDELDHHPGKIGLSKQNPFYFTLRRNRANKIRKWLF